MTEASRRLSVPPPIPFDRAADLVERAVRPLPVEDVELARAAARVLAEDVSAPHSVPPFESSTVDGFAVRAEDVAGAGADRPVQLDVVAEAPAGGGLSPPVKRGTAVRIMTGAPMPEGADAVVMLEWTSFTSRAVSVEREVEPGRFVRRVGEDMREGEIVLEAGSRLGPAAVGILASLGKSVVRCRRRAVVAVLATGDELLEVGEPLVPGKIRSSNNWTLAGQAREAGAEVVELGIARDDPQDLAARLTRGLEADVLLSSGGVSVGDRDLVQDVLSGMGLQRIFWRVESSPGKPLLFGRLGDTLVFGVPGNPVSSMVAFENFVRPALLRLVGDPHPERPRVLAVLDDTLTGPTDRRHFARVRVRRSEEGLCAAEVKPHGSGNLLSMARANGLAVLGEGTGRLERGTMSEVMLLGEVDPPRRSG